MATKMDRISKQKMNEILNVGEILSYMGSKMLLDFRIMYFFFLNLKLKLSTVIFSYTILRGDTGVWVEI